MSTDADKVDSEDADSKSTEVHSQPDLQDVSVSGGSGDGPDIVTSSFLTPNTQGNDDNVVILAGGDAPKILVSSTHDDQGMEFLGGDASQSISQSEDKVDKGTLIIDNNMTSTQFLEPISRSTSPKTPITDETGSDDLVLKWDDDDSEEVCSGNEKDKLKTGDTKSQREETNIDCSSEKDNVNLESAKDLIDEIDQQISKLGNTSEIFNSEKDNYTGKTSFSVLSDPKIIGDEKTNSDEKQIEGTSKDLMEEINEQIFELGKTNKSDPSKMDISDTESCEVQNTESKINEIELDISNKKDDDITVNVSKEALCDINTKITKSDGTKLEAAENDSHGLTCSAMYIDKDTTLKISGNQQISKVDNTDTKSGNVERVHTDIQASSPQSMFNEINDTEEKIIEVQVDQNIDTDSTDESSIVMSKNIAKIYEATIPKESTDALPICESLSQSVVPENDTNINENVEKASELCTTKDSKYPKSDNVIEPMDLDENLTEDITDIKATANSTSLDVGQNIDNTIEDLSETMLSVDEIPLESREHNLNKTDMMLEIPTQELIDCMDESIEISKSDSSDVVVTEDSCCKSEKNTNIDDENIAETLNNTSKYKNMIDTEKLSQSNFKEIDIEILTTAQSSSAPETELSEDKAEPPNDNIDKDKEDKTGVTAIKGDKETISTVTPKQGLGNDAEEATIEKDIDNESFISVPKTLNTDEATKLENLESTLQPKDSELTVSSQEKVTENIKEMSDKKEISVTDIETVTTAQARSTPEKELSEDKAEPRNENINKDKEEKTDVTAVEGEKETISTVTPKEVLGNDAEDATIEKDIYKESFISIPEKLNTEEAIKLEDLESTSQPKDFDVKEMSDSKDISATDIETLTTAQASSTPENELSEDKAEPRNENIDKDKEEKTEVTAVEGDKDTNSTVTPKEVLGNDAEEATIEKGIDKESFISIPEKLNTEEATKLEDLESTSQPKDSDITVSSQETVTKNLKEMSDTKDISVTDTATLERFNKPTTSGITTQAVEEKASVEELQMVADTSDEVPEVTDSLGLLAESFRVVEDDDDQETSDHDDGDDDDDFDPDDESSNQMTTAEMSEDSNAQPFEADLPKVKLVSSLPDDNTQDYLEKDLATPPDGSSTPPETAALEVEAEEPSIEDFINKVDEISEVDADILDEVEGLSPSDVQSPADMESSIDVQSPTVDDEEADDNLAFAISNVVSETDGKNEKETGAAVAEAVDKKSETKNEPPKIDQTDEIKPSEVSGDEAKKIAVQSQAEATDKEPVLKGLLMKEPASKDPVVSPTKLQKLSVSVAQPRAVVNIVDLESSSEDEVQDSAKKSEEVTDLTSEVKADVTSDAVPTESNDVPVKPSTEKTAKEPKTKDKDMEVFNLDSDEDERSSALAPIPDALPNKCINSTCASDPSSRFYAADRMTVAYYEPDRKRKGVVCEDCAGIVAKRTQRLIEGVRNLTPLLDMDMGRPCQDLVEISDSDSDEETEPPIVDSQLLGITEATHVEERLVSMINETWEKFKMDARLHETQSELSAELERLDKESQEIDLLLRECQAATDKLRTELYASFEPNTKNLPGLIIYDTPETEFIRPETAHKIEENRELKRRLSSTSEKPPSKRLSLPPTDDKFNQDKKDSITTATDAAADSKLDDDKDISVVTLSAESAPADLPPAGELNRPPLRVGMQVYAMRNAFGSWLKGRVVECIAKGAPNGSPHFTMCKIKFENKTQKNQYKMLPGRCLAYSEPSDVRMTIGTRLIALFKCTTNTSRREAYYSGIVAEVPNPVNNYRYLVFFDDGYAQYVHHGDTRLVCECSLRVWEEVHPFSREFVRQYLTAYPERPMVRLHTGQNIKTEWNGKWWISRVLNVDASLVQVHFEKDNRTEWIYRGSTRLAPLYLELQAAERHRARPMPRNRMHNKKDMPYVEYTRSDDAPAPAPARPAPSEESRRQQRAVAKKSVGAPQIAPAPAPPPSAAPDTVTSRVVYYTPKNAVKPYKMSPHACGAKCKRTDVLALHELRTYNPLAKPLLSGWERQLVRYKGHKEVVYRAPCGRRLRNIRELHRYLRLVQSDMGVDLFDFSPNTHCLAEFVLNKCIIAKKDLSNGKENVPVPCVNYYDNSLPEFCSYNTERTPTDGVPLNLDPDFLCGCDCTDDCEISIPCVNYYDNSLPEFCSYNTERTPTDGVPLNLDPDFLCGCGCTDDCEDKSKCACWQLTLEGARTIGLSRNVGYTFKRLPEPLPSGIYECNSRCKCKSTCLNRVAQHPLQLKLQIFKTLNRGWGIRALNDVPKGSFLCVYAGNLLTDATANLDGLNEGDEYLAELDYIEVVEQMKEGYEEDIPEGDKKNDSDDDVTTEESSEDETPSKNEKEDGDFQVPYYSISSEFRKTLRKRNKRDQKEKDAANNERNKASSGKDGDDRDDCITISDDEEVREPSRFTAQAGMGSEFVSKNKSLRSFFGKDEACYIMDAKVQGNIGRYLNHSCSPNVFVQNVFVDTHDPRFPWVAFFALHPIRAGTELTWNYNYDVGSVPNKVLYCYCGAPNCRGRLL